MKVYAFFTGPSTSNDLLRKALDQPEVDFESLQLVFEDNKGITELKVDDNTKYQKIVLDKTLIKGEPTLIRKINLLPKEDETLKKDYEDLYEVEISEDDNVHIIKEIKDAEITLLTPLCGIELSTVSNQEFISFFKESEIYLANDTSSRIPNCPPQIG